MEEIKKKQVGDSWYPQFGYCNLSQKDMDINEHLYIFTS